MMLVCSDVADNGLGYIQTASSVSSSGSCGFNGHEVFQSFARPLLGLSHTCMSLRLGLGWWFVS